MRRFFVIIVAFALVVGFNGTAGAAVTAVPAVTKVNTTTDTRCAFLTYKTPTSWYFPQGEPKALVWVQHGFSRSKERMDDLARRYAENGYLAVTTTLPSVDLFGCTLQNTGNNTAYLNNVADLFGKKDSPDKLARSFATAKSAAGRPGLAMPTKLLITGHSAGGEAVSYVANRLRTNYPSAYANLLGVILLDPVASIAGSNLRTGLSGLSGSRTVYTISAPGSTCSGGGSGTSLVSSTIRQPFVGVRLTGGAHTDAEGASTNGLGTLVCGTPQAGNIAILQTLSVAWANDMLSGTRTAAYYPGGSYLNGLGGKVAVLNGAA